MKNAVDSIKLKSGAGKIPRTIVTTAEMAIAIAVSADGRTTLVLQQDP
jgi:hypothetical protein